MKPITFKDKDGAQYERTAVRTADIATIIQAETDHNARVATINAQAAAEDRALTGEELAQTTIIARLKAVFGPFCPNVDFDEMDLRAVNLFADAFWNHIYGNDPN